MKGYQNLLAGLAGAVALNILHESIKHLANDVPRIDSLGEEALEKGLDHVGIKIDGENELYAATLGADVVSNSVYYSMIGMGNQNRIWLRAITLGLLAGVGAVAVPKYIGLDPKPVAKNSKVKMLTVGYYLFGAFVTAAIIEKGKKS